MEHVVTLGATGDGFVSATYAVARGSRYYFVAPTPWVAHEIHVFDREGRFVRTIGRRGAGPGEFEFIRALEVAPGDTLHVFDSENRRWTVLSPALEPVRTQPVPGRVLEAGALLLGDGRVVVNALVPTADAVGYPLHILSPDGGLVRSFGAERSSVSLGLSDLRMLRHIAPGREGGVWSAHTVEYRVEHWNASGRRLRAIRRDADWLVPAEPDRARRYEHGDPIPPRTGLLDVREDADGYLWVVGRSVDSGWRSAFEGGVVKR